MISVVSVVNNDLIAKDFLLRGLRRQNTKYELLLIDNKKSGYPSASKAYNSVSAKTSGDYLMFIHQDVFLPFRNWLKEAEDTLSTVSNLGVAGVAGLTKPNYLSGFELVARYQLLRKLRLYPVWFRRYGRGMVFQGKDKLPWMGISVSEVSPVQTLDELLLVVPSKVFERTKFDEVTCDDWHLHGVDYSLTSSRKGRSACVLPYPVYHLSSGKKNAAYFKTLYKLARKHRSEKVINTTMGLWATTPQLLKLQMRLMNVSRRL